MIRRDYKLRNIIIRRNIILVEEHGIAVTHRREFFVISRTTYGQMDIHGQICSSRRVKREGEKVEMEREGQARGTSQTRSKITGHCCRIKARPSLRGRLRPEIAKDRGPRQREERLFP